ncbi:MAG: PEP-CTERM sorting domain-containing protein [Colwellia sp.]|nr:PEP-CTERM sorting domain-containing protein [Colwellia sp.]
MKFKFFNSVFSSLLLSATCLVNVAYAGIIPYGLQTDISTSTVVNDWGWSECFVTSGSSTTLISNVLSGCSGDSLMMAVRFTGSDQFEILGASSFATATQWINSQVGSVGLNNWDNGLNWYFNDKSWGFTTGNNIWQQSADTHINQNWAGLESREGNNGISYHASGTGASHSLNGGWGYNDDGNWKSLYPSGIERVWLTTNATDVPEPSTLAIFALGMIGLASSRFKKQS